jgi:hypothetical protein
MISSTCIRQSAAYRRSHSQLAGSGTLSLHVFLRKTTKLPRFRRAIITIRILVVVMCRSHRLYSNLRISHLEWRPWLFEETTREQKNFSSFDQVFFGFFFHAAFGF